MVLRDAELRTPLKETTVGKPVHTTPDGDEMALANAIERQEANMAGVDAKNAMDKRKGDHDARESIKDHRQASDVIGGLARDIGEMHVDLKAEVAADTEL